MQVVLCPAESAAHFVPADLEGSLLVLRQLHGLQHDIKQGATACDKPAADATPAIPGIVCVVQVAQGTFLLVPAACVHISWRSCPLPQTSVAREATRTAPLGYACSKASTAQHNTAGLSPAQQHRCCVTHINDNSPPALWVGLRLACVHVEACHFQLASGGCQPATSQHTW